MKNCQFQLKMRKCENIKDQSNKIIVANLNGSTVTTIARGSGFELKPGYIPGSWIFLQPTHWFSNYPLVRIRNNWIGLYNQEMDTARINEQPNK